MWYSSVLVDGSLLTCVRSVPQRNTISLCIRHRECHVLVTSQLSQILQQRTNNKKL